MTNTAPPPAGLESCIDAFESACAGRWPVALDDFLPPAGHPGRAETLCELVRVDLEHGHARGTPKSLDEYRACYPELFARSELAEAVEFEDGRLRAASAAESEGTQVVPSSAGDSGRTQVVGSAVAALSVGSATEVVPHDPDATDRLDATPEPAARVGPAAAPTAMPQVGDEFLGFKLVEALGEGSFGRVFLAHQTALSDRPVALKVTARPNREAQCLARFQHANIVPILSEHRAGEFQAVCMPYFGRTTLGQVLKKLRREKSLPASGLGLVSTLRAGVDETVREAAPSGAFAADPDSDPAPVRAMLTQLNYVDAVVWTVARLADGLAHAHDRGVLHRDLKPDNVLVADDGQPMLLDFNLADESQASGAGGAMGGTVFYMSPEHLAAFQGDRSKVADARSDLYALGLIAYEMLTGYHPYPVPKGDKNLLRAMLKERLAPAASARSRNAAVPATVDAVVAKLIAPSPAARYQSARQLADDLDRHLSHRPLVHAHESALSRARKWVRRNPRAVPFAGLAAALLLAVTAGGVARDYSQKQAVVRSTAARYAFQNELRAATTFVNGGRTDPALAAEAGDRLRTALDHYGALTAADFDSHRLVRPLDSATRADLRRDLGEALFLLARTEAGRPAEALELNRRAEAAFGAEAPKALWRQRADLAAQSGDAAGADAARGRAAARVSASAREFYLDGADAAAAGDWAAALAPLEQACRLDPGHFAATFALGSCYDALGRDAEALECYRAGTALQPALPMPYLKRGAVYSLRGEAAAAERDFDAAIRLAPARADARVARATLFLKTGRHAEAVADFNEAEKLGSRHPRLLLLRSTARQKQGDRAAAAVDRAAGLAARAVNETDHAVRGYALIAVDPKAALAEFDAALALNPNSLVALQNKAHVLDERLSRPAEATAVLDRAVELYPRHAGTRAGRAVNLARAGRRADAHCDAEACLRLDTAPLTLYQLACVYALTAKTEPADRREAMRLLSAALTAGFGDFATVAADPDLAALRATKEFAATLAEFRARAARRGAK